MLMEELEGRVPESTEFRIILQAPAQGGALTKDFVWRSEALLPGATTCIQRWI